MTLGMNTYDGTQLCVGDVVQINEKEGRGGWIGAFVIVTEVKSRGILGFVHIIETHDKYARAYIRLSFDNIEYVGRATLMPHDDVVKEKP